MEQITHYTGDQIADNLAPEDIVAFATTCPAVVSPAILARAKYVIKVAKHRPLFAETLNVINSMLIMRRNCPPGKKATAIRYGLTPHINVTFAYHSKGVTISVRNIRRRLCYAKSILSNKSEHGPLYMFSNSDVDIETIKSAFDAHNSDLIELNPSGYFTIGQVRTVMGSMIG